MPSPTGGGGRDRKESRLKKPPSRSASDTLSGWKDVAPNSSQMTTRGHSARGSGLLAVANVPDDDSWS
jgi:hypothetical protein